MALIDHNDVLMFSLVQHKKVPQKDYSLHLAETKLHNKDGMYVLVECTLLFICERIKESPSYMKSHSILYMY